MLRICAFGKPSIFGADGARLDGIVRQSKRFAILLYLACDQRPGPHRRDELTAMFWPEADDQRGRNALRQTLHVLKEDLGPDVIVPGGDHELTVDPRRLECDARSFVLALQDGCLEAALRLYKGEFLQGFHLSGSPEFGFWAEDQRARLHEMAIRAAKNLAHTAEGERLVSEAVHWWRRALELQPFDEGVIRRVMALLAGSGNRCQAVAEYERFRHRMVSELEVEPSRETRELADIVSCASPEEIPVWVGDRRRETQQSTVPHWRRPEDGAMP